jgi:nicotinamidase-related amidase
VNDAALVVIDMQNDFCDPAARLFVAGAPAIVRNVGETMRCFRAAAAPVIVVVRRHRSAGLDVDLTRLGIFSEDPFLVDSPGTDLVTGLEILESDVVVVKRRWSAFFATDLDIVLRRLGVRSIVLAGVQTPNCIRATANDATSLDYHCLVLSDGTASATPAIQDANLADMAQMGVEIVKTAEVAARLGIEQAVPTP